jgi:hypothetical protein
MAARYVSKLERWGAPPWLRGLVLLILAGLVVTYVGVITAYALSEPVPRRYHLLGLVWPIGIVALVILFRLWQVVVPAGRSKASPP